MIELIQIPWSPYCLVLRRILEFAGVPHQVTNIPPADRSLVWRLSRGRYYAVPLLRDGRTVVFETDERSQVIAKYLETKLKLGLFPPPWEGLQRILWRYVEDEIEAVTFKLNDIYYREFVPKAEQLAYLRHKERKFGRGCLEQWRTGQRALVGQLTDLLLPLEQMLGTRRFLLEDRPRFIDFDLWGMLENFLYSGHYRIPASRPRLRAWHRRLGTLQLTDC